MNKEESQIEFNVRCEKRVNYPGLCALDFENIAHIIVKYLIGWDGKDNKGAFGKVEAFGLAVEEQGRKTLHGHALLYIEGWKEIMKTILFHDKSTRVYQQTELQLRKYLDVIGSVSLTGEGNRKMQKESFNVFKHENCLRNPRMEPVKDHEIRQLRHKKGCQISGGQIVRCLKCDKGMTCEQMIQNGLNMILPPIPGGERPPYPDRDTHTLDAAIINEQMDYNWCIASAKKQAERFFLMNANYNIHATKHTVRCFKKRKECSSNLPQPTNAKTKLIYIQPETAVPSASDGMCTVIEDDTIRIPEKHTWYDCFGNPSQVTLFGIERKRKEEDAYMNTHNPSATLAFGCNNNVTAAVTGRGAIYLTNYSSKGTQKDDKLKFERVGGALARQIRRQNEEGSDDDDPFSIGLRRVIVGFIMQTVAAVISGTLAWFIVKNESRFRFSHEFQPAIPEQIRELIFEEKTSLFHRRVGGTIKPFANAMHFKYRPLEMENTCFYQFYKEVSVKTNSDAAQFESYEFTEGHPFRDIERVVYNSICEQAEKVPLFNWSWLPSTKHLGGPLMIFNSASGTFIRNPACKSEKERLKEEDYCMKFLILFAPVRDEADLVLNGSTTDRLILAMNEGTIWDGAEEIANNIQTLHDSLASGIVDDSLSARTTEFVR